MNAIYVIAVWTTLHSLVGFLPEQYPNEPTCKLALAQRTFGGFNWGQCVPGGMVPKLQRKYGHPLHSKG